MRREYERLLDVGRVLGFLSHGRTNVEGVYLYISRSHRKQEATIEAFQECIPLVLIMVWV